MSDIMIPVLLLSILGILFALILGFASKVFFVKVDEKVIQVRNYLEQTVVLVDFRVVMVLQKPLQKGLQE